MENVDNFIVVCIINIVSLMSWANWDGEKVEEKKTKPLGGWHPNSAAKIVDTRQDSGYKTR